MLQVQHLRKIFGNLVAVDDVTFEVAPGTITGIIGQNGSGKTTIFRMILDFLTPEGKGQVLWQGKPLNDKVYDTVGYLPEERGLYEKMTIEQQIQYFAQLRGMTKEEIAPKIDDWMVRFNVKGKKTDKIKSLSKGNQQKVQVIATLIHEPKLVILDEPFSGLDPVNADFLKRGILSLKEKGACILFSSHNMSNVEEICDRLVMIHNGKQLLNGTVDQVRKSYGNTQLTLAAPGWTLDQLLALPGVKTGQVKSDGNYFLVLEDESYGKAIYDKIVQGQYTTAFYQQPPTLEQIFKEEVGAHNE